MILHLENVSLVKKRIMEASDVSGWMKNYQHQQT